MGIILILITIPVDVILFPLYTLMKIWDIPVKTLTEAVFNKF